MESQRAAFASERELWNFERNELHKRITQLQSSLQNLEAMSSSQNKLLRKQSDPSLSTAGFSNVAYDGSRCSSEPTGDEVWKGSVSDVKPSRTFSDSTVMPSSLKSANQLPSISEDAINERCVSIDPIPGHMNKPSISSADANKNLDGINFKRSAINSLSSFSAVSSSSISPHQTGENTPPTADLTPTKPLSQAHYPVLGKLNKDPYTKDAGHTPLAREKAPTLPLDGASDIATDSDMAAQPTAKLVPHPIGQPIRPLMAPHDSYFPDPHSDPNDSFNHPDLCPHEPKDEEENFMSPAYDDNVDNDPALSGPLFLSENRSEANFFLSEVNSKLSQAANENAASSNRNGPTEGDPEQSEGGNSGEPSLKIKKSMNFGKPLGQL